MRAKSNIPLQNDSKEKLDFVFDISFDICSKNSRCTIFYAFNHTKCCRLLS